jgi:hypothetical protein
MDSKAYKRRNLIERMFCKHIPRQGHRDGEQGFDAGPHLWPCPYGDLDGNRMGSFQRDRAGSLSHSENISYARTAWRGEDERRRKARKDDSMAPKRNKHVQTLRVRFRTAAPSERRKFL